MSKNTSRLISVDVKGKGSNPVQVTSGQGLSEVSPVNSDGYDTDLEIPGAFNTGKSSEVSHTRSSVEVYELSCKENGLLPHSAMQTGLAQPFLRLRYGSIGPQAMRPLCTALMNNDMVTVLDLEDTDIGHQGALYLGATLRENFVIRHLNIANNHIGDEGTEAVTNSLCHNTTVTYLNISGNKLTDYFGKRLAVLLKENDSILRLHVNYNCLRHCSAADIGEALGANNTLEQLDLSWNCFTGQSALRLCAGLQKNISLKLLDLSWNGIGYEGGVALAKLLRKNRSLEYLDVSNTRVMWQNAASLARAIRHNDVLKVLKLGGNPLTTTGAMTLLEAIGNDQCSLELLDITDVPVVAEFHMLAVAIKKLRTFHVIHGGVVNSHGYLGRQVLGTVAAGTGNTIKHPMQVVLEFVRQKQIRLLELFRSMDKAVLLHMTDEAFANRLKKFGLPLYEHEIKRLTKGISGKSDDQTGVTYPKLVKSVADHILRERTRKTKNGLLKKDDEQGATVQSLRLTNTAVKSIRDPLFKRKSSNKKLPKLSRAAGDAK